MASFSFFPKKRKDIMESGKQKTQIKTNAMLLIEKKLIETYGFDWGNFCDNVGRY